jgi:hypothetical protein
MVPLICTSSRWLPASRVGAVSARSVLTDIHLYQPVAVVAHLLADQLGPGAEALQRLADQPLFDLFAPLRRDAVADAADA